MEFLQIIEGVRQQAFKSSTITSAFRKTGIIPFNPKVVLDVLEARRPQTPPPILQDHQLPFSSPFSTPITLRQVNKVANQIQEELISLEVAPTLRNNIERLISGSKANTAELIQTKRDLGRTKLAQETRKRQKAQKNVQLQIGGVLTVADGREMVHRRAQDDIEKARRMVEAADQKIVRTAKRAFEEVAKIARKKRLDSSLRPLYIVDGIGCGRELVRG